MVKKVCFSSRRIMEKKERIRNVSVIGQPGDGKTILINSLAAGLSREEGRRGFSFKSSGLCVEYDNHCFNIMDCPGRYDFSGEVTAALRLTDGAVVVVDCVEGVRVQHRTVLRQAIGEHNRTVLVITKMDRLLVDLQLDGEAAYRILEKIVEDTNVVLSTNQDPGLQVFPDTGTVAFCSGLQGWAFTLTDFAKLYASRWGVDEAKALKRLWGENFFDPATRKWTERNTGSPTCVRGFVHCCYNPIKRIVESCMDKVERLWPILSQIGVDPNEVMKKCVTGGKELVKEVMGMWLPARRSVLGMLIVHLPSPATAQRYRVEELYQGDLRDKYAHAMRECDPDGPLMVYVAQIIPAAENGRFYAFGRVFSGTVSSRMKVRVMGPNFVPGGKDDLCVKSVQRTAIWMGGKTFVDVEDVPCGNIVAMLGLADDITKCATLTGEKEVNAHPIRAMSFFVSPALRVAVQCKRASDLSKLIQGLTRLHKFDPLVLCTTEETGERVVAAAGELHLQVCLRFLVHDCMSGAAILTSEPAVSYRETVLNHSSRVVMSKSPNKSNSLYMEAGPLVEGLPEAIDTLRNEPNARRSAILEADFNWPNELTRKIWCFGPEKTGPNMLLDTCRGVQHLGHVRDSVEDGFQLASQKGPLAHEKMRGVRVDLSHATIHQDSARRRSEQLSPAATRSVHGAFLLAAPRLMEPILSVQIQAPAEALGAILNILHKRSGKVTSSVQESGAPFYKIEAYLPAVESTGFTKELCVSTSGQAFVHCVFDHWAIVDSDPLEEGSEAARLVSQIRARKNLELRIKPVSEYEDHL